MTEPNPCVLVVEDDDKIAALLCDYLSAGGYTPARETRCAVCRKTRQRRCCST